MIKPSTNATFCYVEFCQTLSPYEVVTFRSDLFPLCLPLTASLSLSSHAKIPIRILASTYLDIHPPDPKHTSLLRVP